MESKGAVAIFVKTPGLSPVKTRLGETLGKDEAERFHRLSTRAMAAVAKEAAATGASLQPYWAVAEPNALNHPEWQDLPCVSQGGGALGERLHKVYSELLARHGFVILLGGDSPQLTPSVLIEAARALEKGERFVLGPAEDGGFYLFGGKREIPKNVWEDTPYSDWQTAEILMQNLKSIAPTKQLAAQFDVDTEDDLHRLRKILASRKDQLLPEQAALL